MAAVEKPPRQILRRDQGTRAIVNNDEPSTTREQLQQAISHLESQRSILGDAVVDAALAPLREKLSAQEEPALETAETGERRTVTVLFCDTVGSTALAETMDPETWTEIMNRAFTSMGEAVTEYEGTVARLMGDGLLAFFGAPLAHEDDPRRAVLAGLALLDNIQRLRQQLRSEAGIDFNVRVGINTGLAVVGTVGSAAATEYTVMGDAVNVAARMEQTAEPGSVQITQDTYQRVAPLFDVEPLGNILVKGKRRPVPAYRVLRRRAQPGRLRGLETLHIQSPLVGRDRELSSAQAMLARLMAGQGGLVAILGEAGIGKSRLLREMRQRAVRMAGSEAGPPRWFEGHMLSYGRTISNWPFQEILRSCAGINEEDDPDVAWRKLEAVHEKLLGDQTAEALPDYVIMLSAWGWLGRSYLALGEVKKALEILENGEHIALENAGNLWGYVYLGNGLSEVYLTLAESAEGPARQQWLQKAREVCRRSLKEARGVRLGLPQAQMFQGRCEWLRGRPQAAQEWWTRALATAERTNYRVDMALIHLEMGRYLHNRTHLETAEAMFEEMGAAQFLAQARQALRPTA
ncbi:MAG: adenylate/guanylate cyclase domain-containing protein [Candidatus Promineifilaceae bacterium]